MGFSELNSSNFSIPEPPLCLARRLRKDYKRKEGQRPEKKMARSAECRRPLALTLGHWTDLIKTRGRGLDTRLPVSYTHLTLPTTPYV